MIDPDPSRLTPQQLDSVIELTTVALEKNILEGYSYGRYAHENPDMPQLITWDVIHALRRTGTDLDPMGMAAAHKRSDTRINTTLSNFAGASETPR